MFGKLYFCKTEIDFYLNSKSCPEINSVCSNKWPLYEPQHYYNKP